jgi:DNA-binding NtrC family response regulator
MSLSLLIVDDEEAARYGMRKALEKVGYVIHEADSLATAEKSINQFAPDLVLLDVKIGAESGLDFLPTIIAHPVAPLVIIVTAHGSERMAVEAIKKGAYNYLAKPFDLDDLRLQVHNAFETIRLRKENSTLKEKLTGEEKFGQFIGSSKAMKYVYSLIEKVAQTGASVLILGESGTGKELVAREIHNRSDNRFGPFVALNCAALPESLVESELFGHEKGAFTGANNRRIGKFEAAHHGTLFLDEIGEMSLITQSKLLRLLMHG